MEKDDYDTITALLKDRGIEHTKHEMEGRTATVSLYPSGIRFIFDRYDSYKLIEIKEASPCTTTSNLSPSPQTQNEQLDTVLEFLTQQIKIIQKLQD